MWLLTNRREREEKKTERMWTFTHKLNNSNNILFVQANNHTMIQWNEWQWKKAHHLYSSRRCVEFEWVPSLDCSMIIFNVRCYLLFPLFLFFFSVLMHLTHWNMHSAYVRGKLVGTVWMSKVVTEFFIFDFRHCFYVNFSWICGTTQQMLTILLYGVIFAIKSFNIFFWMKFDNFSLISINNLQKITICDFVHVSQITSLYYCENIFVLLCYVDLWLHCTQMITKIIQQKRERSFNVRTKSIFFVDWLLQYSIFWH